MDPLIQQVASMTGTLCIAISQDHKEASSVGSRWHGRIISSRRRRVSLGTLLKLARLLVLLECLVLEPPLFVANR
ncbi:hypothetical protein SDJN03_24137, partial [Cucurbita argyrosperma subsp. sororia]